MWVLFGNSMIPFDPFLLLVFKTGVYLGLPLKTLHLVRLLKKDSVLLDSKYSNVGSQ